MPELPEVETVRTEIDLRLRGQTIHHVKIFEPRLRRLIPPEFADTVNNLTLKTVTRRAKYILIDFEESSLTLILHLGMSGRISIHSSDSNQLRQKHDHVVIIFKNGMGLHYHDPRRFGALFLTESPASLFHILGPEPLAIDFTPIVLKKALTGKKTSIKAALLDQRVIAGLGNIYVCEALHQSFIHPEKPAKELIMAQCVTLVQAIQDVLERAIAAGGSTLRNHKRTNGKPGAFQHHFNVYNQFLKQCGQCHQGTIQRLKQNNRSTYYCDICQLK